MPDMIRMEFEAPEWDTMSDEELEESYRQELQAANDQPQSMAYDQGHRDAISDLLRTVLRMADQQAKRSSQTGYEYGHQTDLNILGCIQDCIEAIGLELALHARESN